MEFSFFLVILTILIISLYHIGLAAVYLLFWKKGIRYVVLAVGIITLFLSRPLGIFLFSIAGLAILGQDLPYFRKRIGLVSGIFFSLLLIPFTFFYQRAADSYWLSSSDCFLGVLNNLGLLRNYRFVEIFSVASFFWWVYPAILFALMALLWKYSATRSWKTFWYRTYLSFDHRLAALVICLWSGFILLDKIKPSWYNPGVRLVIMDLGIFWSLYYVFYGYQILSYGLRRNRVPYAMGWIALYSVLIISGPVFLVPVVFLMGVGMSDIWMRYKERRLNNRVTKL